MTAALLSGLAGLFLSAFIAATLLPAQSELVLAGLIAGGMQPVWLLVLAATGGNVLGSVVNWFLGRYFISLQNRAWFPVKKKHLQKAEKWYHKYGRWSLLLSWAPIIGDPLTLAAGIMREPLPFFITIVAAAKLARYIVVAMATMQLI